MESERRKVVVVGAGSVGATFCYALGQSGLADEIVLIDRNRDFAEGQVLDLAHGQPFMPTVSFRVGDSADYADAQVIALTAGAKQNPGETRLNLLKRNASIVSSIMDDIVAARSQAIVLVVSNPVDVLTYVAREHSGWPRGRIIGSGTVLDSARLRHRLALRCGVSVHNVHAYMLGEHGDSEFAAWSLTNIAGMRVDEYCPICARCDDWESEKKQVEQAVRDSAYHIIGYKGATYFAVGLAMTRIAGSILRDEHTVLTVSTLMQGEYGLDDVCLSVPCIVSKSGVSKIVEARLSAVEHTALRQSAGVIRQALDDLREGAR